MIEIHHIKSLYAHVNKDIKTSGIDIIEPFRIDPTYSLPGNIINISEDAPLALRWRIHNKNMNRVRELPGRGSKLQGESM